MSSEVASISTRLRRHWASVLLFFVPLGAYLVGLTIEHWNEVVLHVLLTITAVMGIHVLDRLFLIAEVEGELEDLLEDVRADISKQTKSLAESSRSLESMRRSGIERIYSTRKEAGEDLGRDLSSPSNSKIRLIGISLNEFVKSYDNHLGDAWDRLRSFVGNQSKIDPGRNLDIRVLLIDPRSLGARVRSVAESDGRPDHSRRLRNEVEDAAAGMKELEETARKNFPETRVSFECRLYRTAPAMFLALTDNACYVQQYHYWSRREPETPIPTLRYKKLENAVYPYHQQMENHFDMIWDHASVSVGDFTEAVVVGTDTAIHKSAALNAFSNRTTARGRIVHALTHAKRKIVVQGISLHSYFEQQENRMLYVPLVRHIQSEEVEVELLLLNPDCEQAHFRSYREYLIAGGSKSFEDYVRTDHERSKLYRDTQQSVKVISELGPQPKFVAKLYDSAPSCFVLQADNTMFVEQYHYGAVVKSDDLILGKDMPLFEFSDKGTGLYHGDELRLPFRLLENHLQYVSGAAIPIRTT